MDPTSLIFHFWGKDLEENRQFEIFESIVARGLLLTKATDVQTDQYLYFGRDTSLYLLKNSQMARVCFTDATNEQLPNVQASFGGFGIGFELRTILTWGAAPVWYVPNYTKENTPYGKFGEVLSRIGELDKWIDKEFTNRGNNGSPDDLAEYREALGFMVSHFKGMSPWPWQGDDLSYLTEREWRLVAGFPYGASGNSMFRPLTDEEKKSVVNRKPQWTNDFVNGFCYFDGVESTDSVAKNIVQIRVPSKTLENRVRAYLSDKSSSFGKNVDVVVSQPADSPA